MTDSNQNVQELSFANNSGVSSTVNDQASYHATVTTNVTTVPNGTPIPFYGVATLVSNGEPAANVPVAVQIMVDGTTRTLTPTTDSDGQYNVTFQPLQNEAGEYSVAADDPGVTNPAVQTRFEIVGMSAAPSNANVTVVPNTPLTGQFTLTNLSDATLTGMSATASGGPAGLTVLLQPPSRISGNGTAILAYSLDETFGNAATGVVTIHVTSAEGAVLDILVSVSVVPLTPLLATNPGYLNSGMLVGSQTLLSFVVTNNGGAPSGDLQVALPNTSYMTLGSAATIPSLAPGASATVTIELNPPADLPLEQYTGTIAISNSQAGISVPFTLRAITSDVGSVAVLVDDDYTFDESGAPHVQGAPVSLLDPYNVTQVIATGVTDSTGAVTLSNVPAGPCVLQVSAPGHSSYQSSYTVVPGISNNDEVFIARQFVSYNWDVNQTTVQDTYKVQLQTTFQTYVPAPVVTIAAPSSLPTLLPGQSGECNITLTNHGLIAAQGVVLTLPTDPEYVFTALTTAIGTLPAESSVTVPVRVTRTVLSADGAKVAEQSNPPVRDAAAEPLVTGLAVALARSGVPATSADATTDSGPSCTVWLAVGYFYICGYKDVYGNTFAGMHVGLRPCITASAVLNSLATFVRNIDLTPPTRPTAATTTSNVINASGGFAIPPANALSFTCNPAVNNEKQALNEALEDANDPPVNTAPLVTGSDELANASGISGNSLPTTFIATALADLGLLTGQAGNAGYSPADAAQVAGTIATFDQLEADLAGIVATADGNGASIGIAGDINSLKQVGGRLQAVTTAENQLFGGDANWLDTKQAATLQQWMTDFYSDIQNASDGGAITADEEAQLLATTLPSSVSTSEASEFIERWNRTVQYWNQGIFTNAQVPTGQSTDFLDIDAIQTAFNAALTAEQQSQADGYADPLAEFQAALTTMQNDLNGMGVCGSVKLQINQTASMTRSAFTGTLSITNSEGTGAMSNVVMNISITDAQGNPANGEFFVSSPTYNGAFSVVNGNATLPDNSTGNIIFTFIPDDTAASSAPTLYDIGGTIGFTDPSGGNVSIPVLPATITIYPQAKLELNYFLQRDVIGEDPFNPQDNIPSEPAVLGLLVTNTGLGVANNLSISTGQPQIIENQKGLLDTFTIIGTQVGNQQESPSLNVDFGDVASGQTADAEFLLTSTLQGIFTNFTATFTHSDAARVAWIRA